MWVRVRAWSNACMWRIDVASGQVLFVGRPVGRSEWWGSGRRCYEWGSTVGKGYRGEGAHLPEIWARPRQPGGADRPLGGPWVRGLPQNWQVGHNNKYFVVWPVFKLLYHSLNLLYWSLQSILSIDVLSDHIFFRYTLVYWNVIDESDTYLLIQFLGIRDKMHD